MSTKLPTVSLVWEYGTGRRWQGELSAPRERTRALRVDSAAWFTWLADESTRSFSYPLFDPSCGYIVGYMTVRKEQRQRGGCYWVAYRRCQGRVRKVYLGASSRLTQERLEQLARSFLAAGQGLERADGRDGDSN